MFSFNKTMSQEEENNEEQAAAADDTSMTFLKQCSSLREGHCVVINNRPCRIVGITKSETDTLEDTILTAVDIFTGQRLETISSSTQMLQVPYLRYKEYALVDVKDGYLILMDPKGNVRNDIKFPEGEVGEMLEEDSRNGDELIISVLSSMGEEVARYWRHDFHSDWFEKHKN